MDALAGANSTDKEQVLPHSETRAISTEIDAVFDCEQAAEAPQGARLVRGNRDEPEILICEDSGRIVRPERAG